MHIQTVGLLVNPHRTGLAGLLARLGDACAEWGLRLLKEPALHEYVGNAHTVETREMVAMADVLIVVGGDGTILHAVAHAAERSIPILGIHAGTKGFLAEVEGEDVTGAVRALAEGAYQLEQRMLLRMEAEEVGETAYALNDVVISRGSYARLIRVDVSVDGTPAGRYEGDGMIVSSPTGSTGYSLSAGGPIIEPSLHCILMAPICPHSLQARPIVVSDDSIICLRANCPAQGGGMLLTVDGRAPIALPHQTQVCVSRAPHALPFVRLKQYPFFERLQSKLTQWSQ